MRATIAFLVMALLLPGCGRKVCEPRASQTCECEPDLAGEQLCNSEGTGWWACECGPGVEEQDNLEVRSTCKRMEIIRAASAGREGCPGPAALELDPADAWGNSIVVVCAPGGELTVTSSGRDGHFGSSDDLTSDICAKVEKFGSFAEYLRAMERTNEPGLALGGGEEVEHESGRDETAELIRYWKEVLDGSTDAESTKTRPKPRPRPKPKPKPEPSTPSYTDPIGGLH